MIYSINEGLLDIFKKHKPNTTKEEFEKAFKDVSELAKKLESYEDKFLSSSNSIFKRYHEYEDNDLSKKKNDFYKGKAVNLHYGTAFIEGNGSKDSELDIESSVNVAIQFAKSCGFKDIDDEYNARHGHTFMVATNSEKYVNIELELTFDDIMYMSIKYLKNPVVLIKENTKHESTIFEGTSFI